MPLNVPDVGEKIALEAFVNKTAPQDLILRLYQNNITPSDTDVAATFTECTFAGYASILLTGASWGVYVAGAVANSERQFIRSSSGVLQAVYGYYLTQQTSGILAWAERDAAAPINTASLNDTVKVTPTIGAD